MTSEKQAQKFHTDMRHYPDLGSASDWLRQISPMEENPCGSTPISDYEIFAF